MWMCAYVCIDVCMDPMKKLYISMDLNFDWIYEYSRDLFVDGGKILYRLIVAGIHIALTLTLSMCDVYVLISTV